MADSLHVGVVCPYSLSRHGGVQGQVLGLARTLESLGHRATVIAPIDGGRPPGPEFGLPPGWVVGVGRSIPVPANGSRAPLALHPAALVRAARAVRNGHFDVLHIHEPLAPGPGYACLLVGDVPKVGTFHRSGSSTGYRLLAPVARWAAGHLSARCAVSRAAEATAAGALGGEYRIIANGVDTERFAGADPAPTTGPTVLFVGRHEERKGLGVLLDAWTRLGGSGSRAGGSDAGASGGTDAVLWVAGQGPLTGDLRRRYPAGPNLEWLGPVDDAELAGRLRGAHVLCAPSTAGESFGVVLLEAMAAHCAVVASELPGYTAVAAPSSRLVAPGDPQELADALVLAVEDARRGTGGSSADALDSAARRAERWSMRSMTDRYLEVYRDLLRS